MGRRKESAGERKIRKAKALAVYDLTQSFEVAAREVGRDLSTVWRWVMERNRQQEAEQAKGGG